MSKHYFTSIALKPIGFLTLFILLSGGIFAKTHDPPKKSARTGSVLAAVSYSVQADPFPVLTSVARRIFFDADNDGDIDMLYQTSTTNTNDIALKLNNGSGGFATTHSATNGTGTFTSGPLTGISFTSIPTTGLYALDYDKDGDTDLYEGAAGAAGRIIRNNGGNFSVQADPFPVQTSAARRIFFDADNDGDIDMLYQTSTTNTNDIALKLNNGSGGFATTHSATNGTGTFTSGPLTGISFTSIPTAGLYALDYDKDGDTDLYEGAAGAAGRIIRNNGGSFSVQADPFPVLTSVARRIFFDADSDGDIDMLYQTSTTNTNDIALKLNNGSGGFATTHSATNGTGTFSTGPLTGISFTSIPTAGLYALDYDKDGDTDLYEGVAGAAGRIIRQDVPCVSVYTVTTTADAGAGSLRQAMLDIAATSCPGPFTVTASVSGTINLASVLPDITKDITFIGPGASILTVRRSSGGNYRIFTVLNTNNTVSFDGFTIANGSHPVQGGGVYNSGNLTLTGCVVSGNTAPQGGGVQNDNTLTMNRCVIVGNTASPNFGGGLISYGAITMNNCLIVSNRSDQDTGGVGLSGGGSLTAINCTIARNTAVTEGGGIVISGGSVGVIRNSIVAENSASSSANISGNLDAASSYNLIGAESGNGGLTNGTNGNQVGVANARLAALGNYGGPTQTIALLPGSPAINAGTASGAPALDQRGVARVGATDVGSFESQGFTLLLTSGNNQSATVGTVFTNPLRTTVSSTNSEPVDGGVVTYTGPGSGAGIAPASVTASIASGVAVASVTANATTGGPYTVAATANGASPTVNFSLTNTPNIPTITGFTVNPQVVCVGSPITFTATIGNVPDGYNWSLSNGGPPIGSQSSTTVTAFSVTQVATGSGPQTYTLTVTGNGQQVTATTSLTVNVLPVAGLSNNGPLTCAQTSVTLTASGGTSYTFTNGSGTVLAGSGNTRVVSSPGTYSVTVANASGCVSSTSTTVISNTTVPTPTLSASPSTTLTCAQTSLTLTAGGGNAYAFSGPGVVSQSGNTAVVNAAGVYSVTVTNTATGCASTTSITISQNASTPVATLSAAPSTTLTCAQTSLTLTAGGGNAYAFSGPGVVSQSGNTAVVNAAGVYSVTVTNTTTGCFSTTSITINSNASLPTPTLSASPSTTLTCAQTSLTLTAGGGNSYAFSGPGVVSQSGNTAVVNAAGSTPSPSLTRPRAAPAPPASLLAECQPTHATL